ncbi:hypothetical protein COU74_03235 [Candidatus Peregrinibacteria bacterium CG10_big_fil_rev_8_21_14_0_10_36_19]|nr:MAG: hypothetical protein COU74_03235 [Candidatus Peregrinibacteria bacterium CG10_big_fil_rev_8_21_14_0_10_36_19]
MKNYFQAPWSLRQLFYTFLTLIVLGVITIWIGHSIIEYKNYNKDGLGVIILSFLIQWIVIGFSFFLFSPKKSLKLKYWLINKVPALITLKTIVKSYLLYFGIMFTILLVMQITGIKIPGFQPQDDLFNLGNSTTLSLIALGFIIAIIAPVFEEIFFRGFVLQTLVDRIGVRWGNVVTAGVFAIFHMQPQAFFPLFIIGLIINNIAIKNKSIIPSIAFHCFNNTLAFSLQVLISKNLL